MTPGDQAGATVAQTIITAENNLHSKSKMCSGLHRSHVISLVSAQSSLETETVEEVRHSRVGETGLCPQQTMRRKHPRLKETLNAFVAASEKQQPGEWKGRAVPVNNPSQEMNYISWELQEGRITSSLLRHKLPVCLGVTPQDT